MSFGTFRHLVRRLPLAIALATAAPTGFGEVMTEAQLKAAYLVNFLKYVEFPPPRTTINLCLFGRDSVGLHLAAYEGKQIIGRELRIRRVNSPEQIADCQELFIPETEEARFTVILRWVDKQSVLTVSDGETFTRDGGAIALIRTEGRLQFDINTDALSRANLKVSSQMLRLARHITGAAR